MKGKDLLDCEFKKLRKKVAGVLIDHFMICKIHENLIHTQRFRVYLKEFGRPFHKFAGLSTCVL